MSPILMKAVTAITLALIFYTIGVWSEHRAKVLKPVHLAFFWLGLCMDTTCSFRARHDDGNEVAILIYNGTIR